MVIKACSNDLLSHPITNALHCRSPICGWHTNNHQGKAKCCCKPEENFIWSCLYHHTEHQLLKNHMCSYPSACIPAEKYGKYLGTSISSCAQTYLGLPLSLHKLPPIAFQPIIDCCDIYLSGWAALLLTRGGRLIILPVVLDNLPTYFMQSFLLSKHII